MTRGILWMGLGSFLAVLGCIQPDAQNAAPLDGGSTGQGPMEGNGDAGFVTDGGGGEKPGPYSPQSITDLPVLFDATDGSKDFLHTPIPANPVLDPNSAALASAVAARPPFNTGPDWLIPLYVTSNADPVYKPALSYAQEWGCSVGASGIHIPDQATRETPGGADGDGWVATVNLDDNTVKAIWQADKSSGTWRGSCGGTYNLHGNGVKQVEGVGSGSDTQIGWGIILQSELKAGVIKHALYSTSTISCRTFREPATKSDGKTTGTCFPMGARVQLDPAVDCEGLAGASAGERIICKALQTYGFYVMDSGGAAPLAGPSIQADDLTDPERQPWTTPGRLFRGSPGCSPVSASCSLVSSLGLSAGQGALSHIPWNRIRLLAKWDGT